MRIALLAAAALASAAVPAQQTLTVPAAYDNVDAPGQLWVPGATGDLRLMTLIAPPWSDALSNHTLTSLTLRRTVRAEAFSQSAAMVTIRMSTAARSVDEASPTFALNHGPDLTTVFSGTVAFPASPVPSGPAVGWDAANSVTVLFQTPFAFGSGTLCVDIEGTTVGQPARAWAADATIESAIGSARSVGAGCGPYTRSDGRWSYADETTLLAGARARLSAFGTPAAAGLFVLGAGATPNALDLASLGMPGCFIHLSSPFHVALVFFPSTPHPIAALGAVAEYELAIPATGPMLGIQLASQWLDAGAWATSNATQWTVALQPPQNPTCTVTGLFSGGSAPTAGRVGRARSHVMRFGTL